MIRGLWHSLTSIDRLIVMPRCVFLTLVLAACSAGGCAGRHVNWHFPGTIEQQRLRATIHDPYSDPDAGPAVDGGRPRDYIEPLPRPVRNRIYVDSFLGR
jgi:hypothetical protein